MSATPNTKKPATPAGSNVRRPSANTTPTAPSTNATARNRSPSRMAPQASTAGNAATGVNRTRSVRNGAPVSARAAARKPAEQGDAAVEDAKAELQAKMDELQERLQEAEDAVTDSHKQAAVLQMKLDEAHKEQGMLEESVHEHTERIEELQNEKKESLRARRELEQIYEAERVSSMKEKEEATAKEEEMQTALQRMKEALAQREMRAGLEDDRRPSMSRNSSFRSQTASPNPDAGSGQFAPPSSLQRSDSRNSSKLVMQKDKIIESLRLELAEAQIKLVEVENMGGGRLSQLQKEIYEIKMQNARLMEENESFQLLLSEKTLHGDFTALRPASNAGSRPPSRHPNSAAAGGTTLADELASEADDSMIEGASMLDSADEPTKRLQAEVNGLKDQNKALTLYINSIISRLLQHEQFEQILDKTPDIMAGPGAVSRKYGAAADTEKELPAPPPPPEKDELKAVEEVPEQPAGFLQRARSVMGGGRRPGGRPMSQAVSSADQDKLAQQLRGERSESRGHENPETAPRIPIGRSNSTRGNSGHRRANSEWPAASVVTNMYRGPSPALQGPVSPGLSSPTGSRNSFFAAPQPLGTRVPSGSTVPTISEAAADKENAAPFTQRDSKMSNPASHRSSMISNGPSGNTLDITDIPDGVGGSSDGPSNPSSPPRSTTSSGERDIRSGGAIMMGSKPRPLRLVREAADQDEAAKKAANRGSWFGWMNKGAERSVSGGQ